MKGCQSRIDMERAEKEMQVERAGMDRRLEREIVGGEREMDGHRDERNVGETQ